MSEREKEIEVIMTVPSGDLCVGCRILVADRNGFSCPYDRGYLLRTNGFNFPIKSPYCEERVKRGIN